MNLSIIAAISPLLLLPVFRPQPAVPPPTCAQDLNALKAKIQQDYAGFLLEVVGEKRVRHDKAFAALSERAAATTGDDCYFVLQDYIDWFDDPHLFLYQSSQIDSNETAARAGSAERLELDEAKAREYYGRQAGHLDPLEGIWYDQGLRVAVVPAPGTARSAGQFVAVVLTSDSPLWQPGMIRARFTRGANGSYATQMWSGNFSMARRAARIHKRVLLRLSPGMWGKRFPVAPTDSGLVDSSDVHRPTMIVRAGTVIVSIPSHDPGLKPYLDSLIASHQDELVHAQHLIVDLRGNEGGGSFMSDGLLPYILSDTSSDTVDDYRRSLMLSSEDQIRYVSRMWGSDSIPQIQRMLVRMRAHPGELVPLFDSLVPPETESRDTVVFGPKRVAIMIDGGTVSASEVLVQRARQSKRVTIFGEHTAGALDYQSTAIVWFSPDERRWGLGYPTTTARAGLPTGGMRGKGIPPQVTVHWEKIADPIGWVDRALAGR
jgi:hypothetical protein